jgi:hypothetical protein
MDKPQEVTGPLAEMHQLLREAGWEAKYEDDGYFLPSWEWSHPRIKTTITTLQERKAHWFEGKTRWEGDHELGVVDLRIRLKELAQK